MVSAPSRPRAAQALNCIGFAASVTVTPAIGMNMMHYNACLQQQSMVFTRKPFPLRLGVPVRREKLPTVQSHGPAHRPRGPHMSQRTARTAVAQAWTAPDREGGALTLVEWPHEKQGELRTSHDETGPCTTTQ